jgi:hypothetical protein
MATEAVYVLSDGSNGVECGWLIDELRGRGKLQLVAAVTTFWLVSSMENASEVVQLLMGEASRST